MKNEHSNLREARTKAGLTIQELAAKAGLGYGIVQAVETGRLPGTIAVKSSLADALGMSFKELWPETYAEMSALLATGFGKAKRAK